MDYASNANLLSYIQEQPAAAEMTMPELSNTSLSGGDPKTALNTFCQRYCKRAISKTDIVYTSQKIDNVHQAVVRLNCLDGIEFAGEVATTQKDAEKNAAKQALMNYSAEIATLPAANKVSKKRKAPDMSAALGGASAATIMDPTIQNAKVALNTGLMRILHRALTKDDVQYNTLQTALGFQCTISLPSLPGEWAGYAWAGEVANKKKDAEEHAARHAVEALKADAGMVAAMETPPAKEPKKTSKSQGKGTGYSAGYKGASKGTFYDPSYAGYGSGYSGYGGYTMPWKGGGWKGSSWGKGWSKGLPAITAPFGATQSRERITTEPVTGAVLEWKDRYGWLTLHSPIEHPQATKNSGRVYLNMKDWQQPEVLPMEGMTVQMHVYADASGLGAEEASPLDGF